MVRKRNPRYEYTYEQYVCGLGTVKYFPRITKIARTKKLRKVEFSESMSCDKSIRNGRRFVGKTKQQILDSKMTDYLDQDDISRYQCSQISALNPSNYKIPSPAPLPEYSPAAQYKRRRLKNLMKVQTKNAYKSSEFEIKNAAYKTHK